MNRQTIKAVMMGLGSVMELFPDTQPKTIGSKSMKQAWQADRMALRSDWLKIVRDGRRAKGIIDEQLAKQHPVNQQTYNTAR